MSESIALVTATNEIVQNSETVGTAFKTISARIRGATDELGDESEDLAITTSKLRKELKALTGVDIMENDNTFKSTYKILEEISEVYDQLTNIQQSKVAELLGGKVGYNTIQSILGNFDTAKQIVAELDSGLAKGSANKELERSLDSIQGKLNQLKSTWQQFSTDLLDTGAVKGIVDALKGLVSVLDSLTKTLKNFKGGVAGIVGGLALNKITKKVTNGGILGYNNGLQFLPGIQAEKLMGYPLAQHQLNTAIQAKKNGEDLDTLTELSAQMREYAKNTDNADMSVANFYATQTKSAKGFLGSVQAIKTYNNLAGQTQRLAFADAVAISNKELGEQMKQLNGANASARTYFSTIKIGLKDIGANLLGGVLNMGLSIAIGALFQIITQLAQKYEKMIEDYRELASKIKETNDELSQENDTIKNLVTRYSTLLITTSDLSEAQDQLIDIQKEMNEVLGEEVEGLDLVNKKFSENIALIQDRRKKSAQAFLDDKENENKFNEAQTYLTQESTVSENFGVLSTKNNATILKAKGTGNWGASGVWNAIRNIGIKNARLSEWGNHLAITGTVQEQIESLSALYDYLSKEWENTELDSNQRKWLQAMKDRQLELEQQMEELQEFVELYNIKQAIADSNIIDEITKTNLDSIQTVVQDLQNADTSKAIIAASEEYQRLKNAIYNAIPESDAESRDLVDSYFEQIEKSIDQSILNIKDKAKVYEQTLKKFQEETYSTFSDSVGKIDNVLKTLTSGGVIDSSTLLELIKIDSTLLGQFEKTVDGYTISLESLYDVRKKLIQDQKEDIEQEIESNEKYIKDQESLIEHYSSLQAYDNKGYLINDDANRALNQAKEDKASAEERLAYWKTYLELINQGIDAVSLFQQAMSDMKGFKDNISSLYSDEGLDDQFFIDHPELLRYKNDLSALAEEIQKLSNAKASPVIEQLRDAMNESLANGDYEAAQKYNSMIEQLTNVADLSNLQTLESQKKELREQIKAKELYIKGLERQKDKEQKILDSLNKQKEALEAIKEDYETAADTAKNFIDEQIEALDKETEALEENKKAIEEDFDARIQAIKDAMDAIDKETEAIDKEAEAQERLNDLKEKELALEKARNTKVRVYTAERGWVRNKAPLSNKVFTLLYNE